MLDTTTEAGGRADGRLREEIMIWLTTVRSDGQPQSVPVWFLWNGETFLVYSRPGQQKLKNIGSNARAGLHLNANDRSGDVVRVEGTAGLAEDLPLSTRSASTWRSTERASPASASTPTASRGPTRSPSA